MVNVNSIVQARNLKGIIFYMGGGSWHTDRARAFRMTEDGAKLIIRLRSAAWAKMDIYRPEIVAYAERVAS